MIFDLAFIDFDKTIFDTVQFEDDVWKVFKKYGVSKDDYTAAYRRSLCTISPSEFDYTFEEHVAFTREIGYDLPKEKILLELKALLKNDYLFSDAPDFLKFLRGYCQTLILLTAGDVPFQQKKIDVSGVSKLFDEVKILPGKKEEYLAEVTAPGQKVLFLNDSLPENLKVHRVLPQVIVIMPYNPAHSRYSLEEVEKSDFAHFATLSEVKNYVAKFK